MWPVTDILKVAALVRVETEWRTGTIKSQWMPLLRAPGSSSQERKMADPSFRVGRGGHATTNHRRWVPLPDELKSRC